MCQNFLLWAPDLCGMGSPLSPPLTSTLDLRPTEAGLPKSKIATITTRVTGPCHSWRHQPVERAVPALHGHRALLDRSACAAESFAARPRGDTMRSSMQRARGNSQKYTLLHNCFAFAINSFQTSAGLNANNCNCLQQICGTCYLQIEKLH